MGLNLHWCQKDVLKLIKEIVTGHPKVMWWSSWVFTETLKMETYLGVNAFFNE